MSARHKARKRALDILFESQIRGVDPLGVLSDRRGAGDAVLNPYTVELVQGVVEHLTPIDATIAQFARGWDLDRMPTADLCILRIATYELRHRDDVPSSVAISEAVELAQDLSTDESAAFVNGVLASVALATPGPIAGGETGTEHDR
ncbi:MAG: transcription antitermination factor NusB [Actinobacteria bacterium]|nr:transcription antitermination factor NusB [Actinomycetota bacterium]